MDNGQLVSVTDAAAAGLRQVAQQIRLHAGTIRRSFQNPQSKGAKLQGVLRPILSEIDRLAEGCEQGAKQLLALAPQQHLTDLLAFAQSVSDQLAQEQEGLATVLHLLRPAPPCGGPA